MLPASYSNQESDHATAPVPRTVENLYRVVSLRPMLPVNVPSGAGKASIANVPWQVDAACRLLAAPPEECRDDRFVALALYGGGSRASVFGAAVMFELQRYGLLQHVDLVSCVSGGCLTAAYYALSCDDPDDRRYCPPTTNGAARYAWHEETVYPLLERNFLTRWFGNWFWPDNIPKFWFTHFDRTPCARQRASLVRQRTSLVRTRLLLKKKPFWLFIPHLSRGAFWLFHALIRSVSSTLVAEIQFTGQTRMHSPQRMQRALSMTMAFTSLQ